MKKFLTIGAVSALMAGTLMSCSTDGSSEITYNYVASTYNLYTRLDGMEGYDIQLVNYDLKILAHDYTIETSADAMATPGGGKLNIKLNPIAYQQYQGGLDGHGAVLYKYDAANPSESGSEVKNLSVYFTQACFIPETINGLNINVLVPNVSTQGVGYPGYPFYFVANYELDNRWLVRTFWPDQSFDGKTALNINGTAVSNEKMRYRVAMKVDGTGVIGNKADVLIYQAAFSADQSSTEKVVVLKDIDLQFSRAGWSVSGSNITAQTMASNKLEPNTDYVFNTFFASATGDLTEMSCSYELNSNITGDFNGCYMLKPKQTDQ